MKNFIGTFEYNVDAKGRLTVPAKFKNELGENFIIKVRTAGKYACIDLYSNEDFQLAFEEMILDAKNSVERKRKTFSFYAGANEVTPDAKGRILLPAKTAEKAEITTECVMVGMFDHVEVWNPDNYEAYCNEIEEDDILEEAAYVAEKHIEFEKRANGEFLAASGQED